MSFLSGSINPSTTTPADDIGKIKNDLAVLRAVLGGASDPEVPFLSNVTVYNNAGGVPYAFKVGPLIVQVFRITNVPGNTANIAGTFPQAFPTACLGVLMQVEYIGGSLDADGASIQSRSKTGFTFWNDSGSTSDYFCIAIGY